MVRTARLLPSSIVKRSRLQSTLSPRRRIWARIAPPCSAFHSQVRSRNAVAAQLAAAGALGRQRALDQRVDRDRGVVHARQPQGVVALHAAAADQDVDQRVLEGVADVQAAGDVGRRDDDAERRLVRRVVGGEVARSTHRSYMPASTAPGVHWAGSWAVRGGRVSVTRPVYEGLPTAFSGRQEHGGQPVETEQIERACCGARGRAAPPGPRRWWARRRARRRRSPDSARQ